QHLQTLRRDRPFERLDSSGIRGLTQAEIATLRALGAIEDAAAESPADTPLLRKSDSYPHLINGGEKPDERPPEGFATRASLSKWFASREDHHGNVPDSHPGVPLPSRRCPPSW